MLQQEVIQKLADLLWSAEQNRTAIEPFTQAFPNLTIEDAREIQRINLRRRMAAGAKPVGKKACATTPVMQRKFNLNEPVLGYLLSDIIREPSVPVRHSALITPFVGCAILFVMERRLEGPGVRPIDVLCCARGAMPSIEVGDMRFAGSRTIMDAAADNAFNSRLVTAETMADVRGVDFANIPVKLLRNNNQVSQGVSSGALGNPLRVVAWIANRLAEYGECIEAGNLVLTGSLNPAVYVRAGDHFEADFGPLGKIKADFI